LYFFGLPSKLSSKSKIVWSFSISLIDNNLVMYCTKWIGRYYLFPNFCLYTGLLFKKTGYSPFVNHFYVVLFCLFPTKNQNREVSD
jgi:hypothetical protein